MKQAVSVDKETMHLKRGWEKKMTKALPETGASAVAHVIRQKDIVDEVERVLSP